MRRLWKTQTDPFRLPLLACLVLLQRRSRALNTSIPPCLHIITRQALLGNGIMAKSHPIRGTQFHTLVRQYSRPTVRHQCRQRHLLFLHLTQLRNKFQFPFRKFQFVFSLLLCCIILHSASNVKSFKVPCINWQISTLIVFILNCWSWNLFLSSLITLESVSKLI